jgi:AcrR family transcriptional regulator
MPRLTDAVREDRRSRISDAAMRCFRTRGFANTSMADIIAESGLSAGSIYSHFTSKAQLARHASARALDRRSARLQAETDAVGTLLTPIGVLTAIMGDLRQEEDSMAALIQIWAESAHDAELAIVARENIAAVRVIVREALTPWATADASRDAEAATDTVMVVVHGLIVRANVDPGSDLDDLMAAVASTLR